MAESAAAMIRTNDDAKSLLTSQPADMATTLRPFMMIYDEHGNPIASDALLDGKIPLLPAGVLDYTLAHGSDAITWQPREDVRNAIVILAVQNSFKGFVVAGRSLRLVEERESILIKSIALGWITSLIILLFVIAAIEFLTVRIPIAGNA